MSNPVLELQRLLKGRQDKVDGSVVAVVRNHVHVATAQGVQILERADATAYKQGDRVVIRNGALQGKRADESNIPVFLV